MTGFEDGAPGSALSGTDLGGRYDRQAGGFSFIDPHHHLWDRGAGGSSRGFDPEAYSADELRRDVGALDLLASVYVECGAMYRTTGPVALRSAGETEFAARVEPGGGRDGAAQVCAGIVAFADVAHPDRLDAVLDEHERAAAGRLRGIRHTGAWDASPSIPDGRVHPPEHLYVSDGFLSGMSKLAGRALSFDAWVYHPQLGEVVQLASRFPETTIIVDHCGGPLVSGPYSADPIGSFAEWERGIRALAKQPNVIMKLGGLGMRSGPVGPWAPVYDPVRLAEIIRPYIESCIDAFGAERSMFESNFPMDRGSYDYVTIWNAFALLAQGSSDDERRSLFAQTASRAYRLGPPAR